MLVYQRVFLSEGNCGDDARNKGVFIIIIYTLEISPGKKKSPFEYGKYQLLPSDLLITQMEVT